jgi:hypothetical protein
MFKKRYLVPVLGLALLGVATVIATATARDRPAVSGFAFAPATFSVTNAPSPTAAAGGRGTTIRFRVSGRAVTTTVAVARRLPGRRARSGRCVRSSAALRRRPACTRLVPVGALTRRGSRTGRVALVFSGRVGGRALAPGRYRATIVVRDSRRRSSTPRHASFTVIAAGATAPTPAPAPAVNGFPNATNTGVPAGWRPRHTTNGDLTIRTPGTVLDGELVTGNLNVNARNVTIRNSWVYGSIDNQSSAGFDYGGMVIADSDVGPPSGAGGDTFPGVLVAGYTMERVHVHNVSEGPRVAAFNNPSVPAASQTVVIRDSLIQIVRGTCSHNDGIQGFGEPPRTVISHNTIDTRAAGTDCTTGAIFIGNDNADHATVTDNLMAGGGFTMRLGGPGQNGPGGTYDHVTGNRIVDDSWGFGPVHVDDCRTVADWADNSVVRIDSDYRVTSTVRALHDCR